VAEQIHQIGWIDDARWLLEGHWRAAIAVGTRRTLHQGFEIAHEQQGIFQSNLFYLCQYGLQAVMARPDSLSVVARSLQSPSLRTRTLVLEILGAVCLIPGGHRRILEALSDFASQMGERVRFDTIVQCLNADLMFRSGWIGNVRVSAEETKMGALIDLQVAALSFINAVILGGPGREIDFRWHMRHEFRLLNVERIVDRLSETEDEDLYTQIEVYQKRAEADEHELAHKHGLDRLMTDRADAMMSALSNSLKETPSAPYFLKTLQHLVVMSARVSKRYVPLSHVYIRSKYWILLSDFVQQLLLQRENIDIDPDLHLIDINVQKLMSEMVDLDKMREEQEKAKRELEVRATVIKDLESQKETLLSNISHVETQLEEKLRREKTLAEDLEDAKKELAKLQINLKEGRLSRGTSRAPSGAFCLKRVYSSA
jgi:dishevelled associated activator of morphogenesis